MGVENWRDVVRSGNAGSNIRKKKLRGRSWGMPIIAKRLRVVFYVLATLELVLVSVAWGRLPLH